jgi:hypothetical protein
MTTITVVRGGSYAPNAYIICRLPNIDNGSWEYDKRDEANTVLIQMDWDFPSIASDFGFVPCDMCHETDGTVDCEHHTATEMITAAAEYLDDCEGQFITDPGYFE